jgi:hypothetical protein
LSKVVVGAYVGENEVGGVDVLLVLVNHHHPTTDEMTIAAKHSLCLSSIATRELKALVFA